jgi:hypothetical protein
MTTAHLRMRTVRETFFQLAASSTILQGLTINVVRPSSATPTSKLPVVLVCTSVLAEGYDVHSNNLLVDFRWWFRNWWFLYVCLNLAVLYAV